jgi:hypothetical protein
MAALFTTDSNSTYAEGKVFKVYGKITIAAATPYVTGGILLPLNDPLVKATKPPIFVVIQGISGFQFRYAPGTDTKNGKLKIFSQDATAGNPLAELAAAAVPASVSSDVITCELVFAGMR